MNDAQADFRGFSHHLSFGGGLALPVLGGSVRLDYAYTSLADLQNIHVFSFEMGGR